FTAGLIPSMETNEMQRVYRLLKEAREEGIIPWEWIVDETREFERVSTWDDPAQYARIVAQSYRRDFWNLQPFRCEVWSENPGRCPSGCACPFAFGRPFPPAGHAPMSPWPGPFSPRPLLAPLPGFRLNQAARGGCGRSCGIGQPRSGGLARH